jgi:hypothetical protein
VPLHGRNLIPGDDVRPGLRQTILDDATDHQLIRALLRQPPRLLGSAAGQAFRRVDASRPDVIAERRR